MCGPENRRSHLRANELLAERRDPKNDELVIAMAALHGPEQEAGQPKTVPTLDLPQVSFFGPALRALHRTTFLRTPARCVILESMDAGSQSNRFAGLPKSQGGGRVSGGFETVKTNRSVNTATGELSLTIGGVCGSLRLRVML